MDQVRKKLREARFFQRRMSERTQMAFGDHEEFDFYLSALLSAARSIDYRLRHEQGATYSSFRDQWDKNLSPDDKRLVKFLVDDRNLEVHESGSGRNQGETRIPVLGEYRDKSGTLSVSGTPLVLAAATGSPPSPPAEIVKPTYSFRIDGLEVPVSECCEKYLGLLERLLADYCSSQGISP
jgi:hypothetical protein